MMSDETRHELMMDIVHSAIVGNDGAREFIKREASKSYYNVVDASEGRNPWSNPKGPPLIKRTIAKEYEPLVQQVLLNLVANLGAQIVVEVDGHMVDVSASIISQCHTINETFDRWAEEWQDDE